MTPRSSLLLAAVAACFSVFLVGFTGSVRPSELEKIDPEKQIHPDFRVDPDGSSSGEFRNIDGTGNHMTHYELGGTDTMLRRVLPDDYGDQVSSMAGSGRPSPREISNFICAEDERTVNSLGATDFLWQWGQFLDHDIDLTETHEPFNPEHVRPDYSIPPLPYY